MEHNHHTHQHIQHLNNDIRSSTLSEDSHSLISLLTKAPTDRSSHDLQAMSYHLKEQTLFPQFQHDMTVLTKLCQVLRVKHLEQGQVLFGVRTKEDNLYKLLRGEAGIKREKDGLSKVKGKGEFVQTVEEFKSMKDIEVVCREQCYFLVISYSDYQQLFQEHLINKKTKEMLATTPLLSALKRRQLAFLLEGCHRHSLTRRQTLYSQGDNMTPLFYFVLEGQIAIQKKNSQSKAHSVCYLNSGSFFGQEVLFQHELRPFSAVAHSSQVQLLVLPSQRLQETFDLFKVSKQSILTDKYKSYLNMKLTNYHSKVENHLNIQGTLHHSLHRPKLSPLKLDKMDSLLRGIENNGDRLGQKERILEKRYKYSDGNGKRGAKISVENPLFGRQNNSMVRQYLRRGNVSEVRSTSGLKLPQIQ